MAQVCGCEMEHARLSPYQRAKLWSVTECKIADGQSLGGNDYDPYVPVEVRAFAQKMRSNGITPRFTDRHFVLWAALTEIIGAQTFTEPFGWKEEDVACHLLGFNL